MKKLIPTIIQDYKSKAVYMLGYSSVKSLEKTKKLAMSGFGVEVEKTMDEGRRIRE